MKPDQSMSLVHHGMQENTSLHNYISWLQQLTAVHQPCHNSGIIGNEGYTVLTAVIKPAALWQISSSL